MLLSVLCGGACFASVCVGLGVKLCGLVIMECKVVKRNLVLWDGAELQCPGLRKCYARMASVGKNSNGKCGENTMLEWQVQFLTAPTGTHTTI